MSSSRVGLRFFAQASRPTTAFARAAAPLRNNNNNSRQMVSKRLQTTSAEATAAAAAPAPESLLRRLWTSEVGIKTVHFWAPIMKWAIVIAGVSDFFKPAEKLSLTQNGALMATGTIWTRWCFVIKPRNILLAAVNFCLACVGAVQVTRIFLYQRSQAGSTAGAIEEMEGEAKDTLKTAQENIKKAAQ